MTDTEKLQKLIDYINDAHDYVVNKKRSPHLTSEQRCERGIALEDILLEIEHL